MNRESRRKQLTIKFLICQKQKAKINESQFRGRRFCPSTVSGCVGGEIGNEKSKGLRQWPDRFSVITFPIFHRFDIEEFHFGKAFHFPQHKSIQTISLLSLRAMISQINQRTFFLSLQEKKRRKRKSFHLKGNVAELRHQALCALEKVKLIFSMTFVPL